MDIIIVSIAALIASILTFFSGFGLGTILSTVMIAFFPIEIAIALTAIVHFLNNIFKIIVIGKYINKEVVLKFGIPAILGALIGAYLLTTISSTEIGYSFFGNDMKTSQINILIGFVIFLFSLIDFFPNFFSFKVSTNKLIAGGVLSGFFGGLSGHQGALRSSFLIKMNLPKEVYVASGTAIAMMVDIGRISLYFNALSADLVSVDIIYMLAPTLFALAGVLIGKRILKKVTISFLQNLVGGLLMIFGISLALGLL